jgi:UDP-N-acetylmuramyl pentapeptide synthase
MGRMPIEVRALGLHNISNALAAIAVGLWLGRTPLQVRDALLSFRPPPMRMSREEVAGVALINDAYNANPRSMEAAVAELATRPSAGRRVAVLGEMLELGVESERHHRALGRKIAHAGIDLLWAIGPSADLVAEEARGFGMAAEAVARHASVEEALAAPPFEPRAGDTWLFKASRGMALERVVEKVRGMADPDGVEDPAPGAAALGRRDEPRAF